MVYRLFDGSGDGEIRTHDPLLARQVLSQLSYTPASAWTALLLLPRILGTRSRSVMPPFPHKSLICGEPRHTFLLCPDPDYLFLFTGLKWTRTTDLTLIRRAL